MEIYKTAGVCASEIHFEIKDGIIEKATIRLKIKALL